MRLVSVVRINASVVNMERILHVKPGVRQPEWSVQRQMRCPGVSVETSDVEFLQTKDKTMLPDYIIYDELKKERERGREERPRIEIETPAPYRREPDSDDHGEEEENSNRGVEIIQI